MRTEVDAFDSEIGEDIVPVNLPSTYRPAIGQIIETTNGMYEVKGWYENDVDGFITRISLVVGRSKHL